MATSDEISAFRLKINETDDTTYTDQQLSDRLDAATSENRLAADIWLEKAAKFGSLVDMQEGTSRRSLSQMAAHAISMMNVYAGLADGEGTAPVGKRTTTRAIERP